MSSIEIRSVRSNPVLRGRVRAAGVLACALLFIPAMASAALEAASGAEVKFTALGPAGLRIVGETSDLTVIDDGTHITVRVPLQHIETGIGLRDRHTKEHLEVARFPHAELVTARANLRFPAGSATSGSAQGKVRIHGRERPVTFRYTATPRNGAIEVSGTFKVDIRQHGVRVPSYLGVTVQPEVDIQARFTVRGQ